MDTMTGMDIFLGYAGMILFYVVLIVVLVFRVRGHRKGTLQPGC
jgi:hypothetical protein